MRWNEEVAARIDDPELGGRVLLDEATVCERLALTADEAEAHELLDLADVLRHEAEATV